MSDYIQNWNSKHDAQLAKCPTVSVLTENNLVSTAVLSLIRQKKETAGIQQDIKIPKLITFKDISVKQIHKMNLSQKSITELH